jgi:predicted GH43/DUF377 family glycosyl hydrolase
VNAELTTARPAGARTRIGGFPLPGSAAFRTKEPGTFPASIELPHPAIEDLPAFVRRVDSAALSPGCRHYNGSICRHLGRIFMAYRFEGYDAVSRVGVCEMDEGFGVLRDRTLEPEIDPEIGVQIEDPHMASVAGKLICIVSHVVRSFPPVCRQRILEIDPESLSVAGETPCPLGNVNGIEKNWTPFELPGGELGVVYKQTPRTLARVSDREGWVTPGCPMKPAGTKASVSGRTGPLRIGGGLYLEFVGGHVEFNQTKRGTRYWFGALVFEDKAPFSVRAHTKEPLAWASEASPTLFNPLPGGGHPVCILPAGAMLEDGGRTVAVSCGVNDSYIAVLRYDIPELLASMTAVQ